MIRVIFIVFFFSKIREAAGLELSYSDFVTSVINAELRYSSKEKRQWNKNCVHFILQGKTKNLKHICSEDDAFV